MALLRLRSANWRGRRPAPPDDRLVAGAAADVAGERLDHVLAGRVRRVVEQRLGGHDHARRAEAALRGEAVEEGALQRMQHAVPGKARRWFRCAAPSQVSASVRQESRSSPSIMHRAGAAGALMAAALGRGVAELVAQRLEQRRAALDELGLLLAVERELDRNLLRHCFLPGVSAAVGCAQPSSSRRKCTGSTSRAIPGAGDRVGDRRGCRRRRPPTAGAMPSSVSVAPTSALSAALARIGRSAMQPSAIARRRDGARRIADRCSGGDAEHRDALRLDARRLSAKRNALGRGKSKLTRGDDGAACLSRTSRNSSMSQRRRRRSRPWRPSASSATAKSP